MSTPPKSPSTVEPACTTLLATIPGGTRILGRLREPVAVSLYPDRLELVPAGVSRLFRLGAQPWRLPFDRVERVVRLDDGGLALDTGDGAVGRRVYTLDGDAARVLGALAGVSQGFSGDALLVLSAARVAPGEASASGLLFVGPGGLELVGRDGTPLWSCPLAALRSIREEGPGAFLFTAADASRLEVEADPGGAARLRAFAASVDKLDASDGAAGDRAGGHGRCRRAFFRVRTAEALSVLACPVELGAEWQDGSLVDFSAGGFRVRVQGAVEPGDIWALELPLHLQVPGLLAEAVYVRQRHRSEGESVVGFRLIQPTPHQIARLQREALRHERLHRTRFERVEVVRSPAPEPAVAFAAFV
jgi:hypothetical protein